MQSYLAELVESSRIFTEKDFILGLFENLCKF